MSEQKSKLNVEFESCAFPNDTKMESVINKNGVIVTNFRGISMYPMLRQKKDLVVIEKVTRPLVRYDVPLYRLHSGKLVLHRILSVKDGKYVIRGDNLMKKELNVTDDMIIGVLKGFYHGKKYVDCKTNIPYKLYIRLNLITYPLRWVWRKVIRSTLSKIKHLIIK